MFKTSIPRPCYPARGRPARRPATGEEVSVYLGQAALDPRRICRGRPAFRGRLVPARQDLSAIRRRARFIRTVASLPGAHGIALVLNERGVNEALASGVAEIATVVSATEEHSQANANRSRESAIANVKRLCESARRQRPQADRQCRDLDGAGLFDRRRGRSEGSDADGGKMPRCRRRFRSAIADTVGYAGPKQVGDLTKAAVKLQAKNRSAFTCTIPAAWASPMHRRRWMPAHVFSMARSAASAAARSRPALPAMSCSRIWSSCARARVLPPASTSKAGRGPLDPESGNAREALRRDGPCRPAGRNGGEGGVRSCLPSPLAGEGRSRAARAGRRVVSPPRTPDRRISYPGGAPPRLHRRAASTGKPSPPPPAERDTQRLWP